MAKEGVKAREIKRQKLVRVTFREMALEGKIPGVRKASW
ncbi:MAG: hypothetical protein EOO90_30100 [Pedobacter sp.]|nr:MAG: hypothetical protein EOO90_30100 [Pedobacter sp.]